MQDQNTAQNSLPDLSAAQAAMVGSNPSAHQPMPGVAHPHAGAAPSTAAQAPSAAQTDKSYLTDATFQDTDLFELLGMEDMPEAEQDERIDEIMTIVLSRALEVDLPNLLPAEDNNKIADYVESGEDVEGSRLVSFLKDILTKNNIDFDSVIYTRSLMEKYRLVEDHIDIIEEAVKMQRQDNPAAPFLEEKAQIAQGLRAAFNGGEWERLPGMFKQYDQLLANKNQ